MTAEHLATLIGQFPRKPAYRGLRQALQELIGGGRIPLGTRLPSERAISQALAVSRNTVTRVYADLVAAGYATARQGAGTFVEVPDDRRRAHEHSLRPLAGARAAEGAIDLNCAATAAIPGIASAYERALERLSGYLGSEGHRPIGLPTLRALIAQMYARRGLPTDPEQIMVTSGALAGTAVVARALSRPGDRAMIESPVYPNAIEALRLGGARLVASPMADALGEEGWDLDGIEATLRQTRPHLAYLIPDFQNPTGFLMRDEQRARYAAALQATRTTAVVDESLQAIALTDAGVPLPFAAHAAGAITIGSVSKLLWSGLRVGWIRAPHDLIERLIKARLQFDLGTAVFDQLVVTELLDSGDVVAMRRAQLRQRRDALAHAIEERLPDWRFRLPEGGMTLWLQLPGGSATQLAAQLETVGVHVPPGPMFSVEGGNDRWLRIPYVRPEEELIEAVARIADAWSRLPAGPSGRRDRSRAIIL
ncbi:PLP-dependent aminotransferase family protein [Lysobacter sp. BMK333-48F3]|uniref:MocR-like transcription factor YczR n=1 Tax=Lysobacter sp. BMK333-48F3 TaxID=2867962 RepID=UPI001C8B76BF|nr:PLP-dependent aminotransferase family protein [Lysobacter sp. BMK333-48F3]MBX9402603.1 PLP-dependent aminotransferase family protein [Lysobacter sp. BMK333-48F3]